MLTRLVRIEYPQTVDSNYRSSSSGVGIQRGRVRGIDRLREYQEAVTRIAGRKGELGSDVYAPWLLDFEARTVECRSLKGQRATQTEALVFAYGGTIAEFDRVIHKPMPPLHQVREGQEWLRALFQGLQTGREVGINHTEWKAILQQVNGRLLAWSDPLLLRWPDAFKVRVFEALRDPKVKARFRFCLNEPCARPFWATKRQAYCSDKCSQTKRTRRYRTGDPDRFRAKRREAYGRRKREELGWETELRIRRKKP